jgi:hypothetical protein
MKTLIMAMVLATHCFPLMAATLDFGRVNVDAKNVSMVVLLASPTQFERVPIRVIGAFSRDIDGTYLFLGRDSLEAYDTASAIGLPASANRYPATEEQLGQLEGCLVAIEGIVEVKSGAVVFTSITRIFNKGTIAKRAEGTAKQRATR